MKKELRDKWAAALRSGEYKQGKKVLHDQATNTYCCLGVLCEVSGDPRWDGKFMGGNNYMLPLHIADEYDLDDVDSILMRMNDEDNRTFPEIADYIEQNIPVEE